MTDAESPESWDAAVVAARAMGSPLGRVAKRFGVDRQAVLDAQDRFNARRKAAKEVAKAMAAVVEPLPVQPARVQPPPVVQPAAVDPAPEGEAPFLRAYNGNHGIAWRVDQRYEDDDGQRQFRVIYDLGQQVNREAATAAWEAARARGDKPVFLRPPRKPKPPPPQVVALADLLTLQELADRWGVSVAVAKRHVRLHAIESIQVAIDPEARFMLPDIVRWENDAQRVFRKPDPAEPVKSKPGQVNGKYVHPKTSGPRPYGRRTHRAR